MAQTAQNAISTHERVCAERWRSAMDTMSDIKRLLGWGIAAVFGILISVVGFFLAHIIV